MGQDIKGTDEFIIKSQDKSNGSSGNTGDTVCKGHGKTTDKEKVHLIISFLCQHQGIAWIWYNSYAFRDIYALKAYYIVFFQE